MVTLDVLHGLAGTQNRTWLDSLDACFQLGQILPQMKDGFCTVPFPSKDPLDELQIYSKLVDVIFSKAKAEALDQPTTSKKGFLYQQSLSY